MKKLKVSKEATKLQKRVARILNSMVEKDYPLKNILEDLLNQGCGSGMIGELIYTYDCVRFYKLYKKEIDCMVSSLCEDTGCQIEQLFRHWDKRDPLAREEYNQNMLAWFGFEETARRLANENGFEF